MFHTSKAIVLRSYPFKDNKRICNIYTEKHGVLGFLLNKKQSILSQPLSILELTYRAPTNKNLFFIKEFHLDYVYHDLNSNYKKLNLIIILTDILNKCLNDPNTELFHFIKKSLIWLDKAPEPTIGFKNIFLIKMCQIVGVGPCNSTIDAPKNYQFSISEGRFVKNKNAKKSQIVPPEESFEIYNLSQMKLDNLTKHRVTETLNDSVFNYIIMYISSHLTDLTKLRSIKILKQLT